MIRRWTPARASGTGVAAALVAAILWPVYAAWPEVFWPFVAALALTALCGLTMLAYGLYDLATRKRGLKARHARMFDLILGGGLSAFGLLMLNGLF
jgi:hypothetical protein